MFGGINRIIKAYICWDLAVSSAWGLLAPVFSIFLLEKVAAGNVVDGAKIAGFATLFYWMTKSIVQVPIAKYLDKNHGEIDDFWFFVTGTIITGLVPLGFLFAYLPSHIYALQVIHALGMSMIIPSSYAIFIRHVDKGKEAYESGLDNTFLGIGAGIAGALGGIMAGYIGFSLIFFLTSICTLLSVFLIFPLRSHMLPRVRKHIHEIPLQKYEEQ